MIFVFKTSVKNKLQVRQLKPFIDKQLPGARWNFDLKDRDNILRVDHDEDVVLTIKGLLNSNNFYCEELE